MQIEFSETLQEITIRVHYSDKEVENLEIELLSSRELMVTSAYSISLIYGVSPQIQIQRNLKDLDICLRKETERSWNTLDGKLKPNTMYEIDCDTKNENETLEALFKKIYENADEDVKRAMNKSLFESNGTVLSTNWDDVKSKKVMPKK